MEELKLFDHIRVITQGQQPLIGRRHLHRVLMSAIATHDLEQVHDIVLQDPAFVQFVLVHCHQAYPTLAICSLKQALELSGFASIGRYAGLFYLPEPSMSLSPSSQHLFKQCWASLEKILAETKYQLSQFSGTTAEEVEQALTIASLAILPELVIAQGYAQATQKQSLPWQSCLHTVQEHRREIGLTLLSRCGFSELMKRQFNLAHQLEIPAHHIDPLPIAEIKARSGRYSAGLMVRSVLMRHGLTLNPKGCRPHRIWQQVA